MRRTGCRIWLTSCRLALSDLVIVLDAGKNSKGVGKLCGKLREGGLVSVYVGLL